MTKQIRQFIIEGTVRDIQHGTSNSGPFANVLISSQNGDRTETYSVYFGAGSISTICCQPGQACFVSGPLGSRENQSNGKTFYNTNLIGMMMFPRSLPPQGQQQITPPQQGQYAGAQTRPPQQYGGQPGQPYTPPVSNEPDIPF